MLFRSGCSSGEEPYTLAILTLDFLKKEPGNWDVGILGTDISTLALSKAAAGIYTEENISRLPEWMKSEYFIKQPDSMWAVKERVKELILFKKLNLMRSDYPFKGKFDAIFCRNVMIYFDKPTRDALTARFARYTAPGGYLFIGHSETLRWNDNTYKYLKPAVYRKEAA